MSTLALALLCFSGPFASIGQEDLWARLWAGFERLRGGEASGTEAVLLRTQLMDAASANESEPRRELLRAALERLGGRENSDAALRLASLEPDPFAPSEHWYLADLLPSGPMRARAVFAALQAPGAPTKWQTLLAWHAAVDEARALRLKDGALPLQEGLYLRCPADWSATDLALTLRLLGNRGAADRTIADVIAREQDSGHLGDLWSQRGVLALGFGDEPLARNYFGNALAQGSDDAGLMLARMDLIAGSIASARRGFRSLLDRPAPLDWAWRGWGTTLLPMAAESPVTRHLSH